MSTEVKYQVQNSRFIHPESCGSAVGYYITVSEHRNKYGSKETVSFDLTATIVLSDCSHKIEWTFCEDQLDKVDAAIDMLKDFRRNLNFANNMVERLTPKKLTPKKEEK
jgi:hypothetical protein